MRYIGWLILFVILMGVVVMITPPQADAGGYCFTNRSYYTPTYQAQTVYAAPYQTYTQTYYTPKVIEAIVAPDYYYSVGGYYRDKVLADAIVGRLAELQLKNQQNNPPPQPQVLPPSQQTPKEGGIRIIPQTPDPMQNLPQEQGSLGFEYQDPKLQAVVEKSCVRCHTEGKAAKGLIFVRNGKLVPHTAETWNEAFVQVSLGEMPQGGKPIEDAETVLFRLAALSVKTGQKVVQK